jgi:hypothetical protein
MVTVQPGTGLTFDVFWRWLKRHPNCILRAGTPDSFLYDHEDLHWHLDQDADGSPLVQLVKGKVLLAELVLDIRDVLFVQSRMQAEEGAQEHVFEVIGGPREDPYPVYHFVLSHAYDEENPHPVLKH